MRDFAHFLIHKSTLLSTLHTNIEFEELENLKSDQLPTSRACSRNARNATPFLRTRKGKVASQIVTIFDAEFGQLYNYDAASHLTTFATRAPSPTALLLYPLKGRLPNIPQL